MTRSLRSTVLLKYSMGAVFMRKPLETILKSDVQKIFDHFSSCFDIRILFYSTKGEELSVGLNQPDSRYCRLVQDKLFGEEACLAMDEMKRNEAAQMGSMICYECHAGLVEAIIPINFGGRLLGFVRHPRPLFHPCRLHCNATHGYLAGKHCPR
jgi:hypothetical protein